MTFSRLVDQAAAFFGSKAGADFEKALSQVIISVQAERVHGKIDRDEANVLKY
jgi:hypothetical protein